MLTDVLLSLLKWKLLLGNDGSQNSFSVLSQEPFVAFAAMHLAFTAKTGRTEWDH